MNISPLDKTRNCLRCTKTGVLENGLCPECNDLGYTPEEAKAYAKKWAKYEIAQPNVKIRYRSRRELSFIILVVYLPVLVWCSWVYLQTGTWGMSTQRGEHWNRYVVPYVEQYTEGRPMIQGFAEGAKGNVTFEGLVKAWFWGGMKLMFSPALTDLFDMAGVDRVRFSYAPGSTDLDRARQMLDGWTGTLYTLNVVVLGCFYLLCLKGLSRTPLPIAMIVVAVILITGPVGQAKYRLIMEPMLCLMAGIGVENDLEP